MLPGLRTQNLPAILKLHLSTTRFLPSTPTHHPLSLSLLLMLTGSLVCARAHMTFSSNLISSLIICTRPWCKYTQCKIRQADIYSEQPFNRLANKNQSHPISGVPKPFALYQHRAATRKEAGDEVIMAADPAPSWTREQYRDNARSQDLVSWVIHSPSTSTMV